jgi:hypothetical protein
MFTSNQYPGAAAKEGAFMLERRFFVADVSEEPVAFPLSFTRAVSTLLMMCADILYSIYI